MGPCKRHTSKFIIFVALLVATSAAATEPMLHGTIMASQADPGSRGAWRYEMRVSWRNEAPATMRYVNLKIDDGTHCSADDINAYILWDAPAGRAHCHDVNATLYFDAELEMGGDPTLSIFVPLVRFLPNAASETRPSRRGVAEFVFWSDLPPSPIDVPNQLLSEKFAVTHGFGQIDGVFPSLPCNPIPAERASWGTVKAGYGR